MTLDLVFVGFNPFRAGRPPLRGAYRVAECLVRFVRVEFDGIVGAFNVTACARTPKSRVLAPILS